MRYKLEFEFDVDFSGGSTDPLEWHWSNLLEDIEDAATVIDHDSIKLYKQNWEMA